MQITDQVNWQIADNGQDWQLPIQLTEKAYLTEDDWQWISWFSMRGWPLIVVSKLTGTTQNIYTLRENELVKDSHWLATDNANLPTILLYPI